MHQTWKLQNAFRKYVNINRMQWQCCKALEVIHFLLCINVLFFNESYQEIKVLLVSSINIYWVFP